MSYEKNLPNKFFWSIQISINHKITKTELVRKWGYNGNILLWLSSVNCGSDWLHPLRNRNIKKCALVQRALGEVFEVGSCTDYWKKRRRQRKRAISVLQLEREHPRLIKLHGRVAPSKPVNKTPVTIFRPCTFAEEFQPYLLLATNIIFFGGRSGAPKICRNTFFHLQNGLESKKGRHARISSELITNVDSSELIGAFCARQISKLFTKSLL